VSQYLTKLILDHWQWQTATFEFAPMTLLVGPHGSGKTAIQRGISAVQAIDVPGFGGATRPGDLVDLLDGNQALLTACFADGLLITTTLTRTAKGASRDVNCSIASGRQEAHIAAIRQRLGYHPIASNPARLHEMSEAELAAEFARLCDTKVEGSALATILRLRREFPAMSTLGLSIPSSAGSLAPDRVLSLVATIAEDARKAAEKERKAQAALIRSDLPAIPDEEERVALVSAVDAAIQGREEMERIHSLVAEGLTLRETIAAIDADLGKQRSDLQAMAEPPKLLQVPDPAEQEALDARLKESDRELADLRAKLSRLEEQQRKAEAREKERGSWLLVEKAETEALAIPDPEIDPVPEQEVDQRLKEAVDARKGLRIEALRTQYSDISRSIEETLVAIAGVTREIGEVRAAIEVERGKVGGTYTIEAFEEEDERTKLRITCDGNVVDHYDGGEPEDNYFFRDWSWVPDELERAYKTGLRHGRAPAGEVNPEAQKTIEALQARHSDLEAKVGQFEDDRRRGERERLEVEAKGKEERVKSDQLEARVGKERRELWAIQRATEQAKQEAKDRRTAHETVLRNAQFSLASMPEIPRPDPDELSGISGEIEGLRVVNDGMAQRLNELHSDAERVRAHNEEAIPLRAVWEERIGRAETALFLAEQEQREQRDRLAEIVDMPTAAALDPAEEERAQAALGAWDATAAEIAEAHENSVQGMEGHLRAKLRRDTAAKLVQVARKVQAEILAESMAPLTDLINQNLVGDQILGVRIDLGGGGWKPLAVVRIGEVEKDVPFRSLSEGQWTELALPLAAAVGQLHGARYVCGMVDLSRTDAEHQVQIVSLAKRLVSEGKLSQVLMACHEVPGGDLEGVAVVRVGGEK